MTTENTKTKIPLSEQYDTKYLNGIILSGRDVVLTVTKIHPKGTVTYDDGRKSDKPVLEFAETKLRYALPKVNLRRMINVIAMQGRSLDTSDMNNLAGERFIFTTELDKNPQFPGQKVPCVRVKQQVPPPKQTQK